MTDEILRTMPNPNDLWRGLGGYFDSLGEILCEFIDNSISNFRKHNAFNRSILIKFEDKNSYVDITIEDSGSGILSLTNAFTLGSQDCAETTLNEHGLGFKHALASANPDNNNWEILTCTQEDVNNKRYKKIYAPYVIGNQPVDYITDDPWPSSVGTTGTIIKFICSKDMFNTIRRGLHGNYQFQGILEVLKEDLGFIYSEVLKEYGVTITLIGILADGSPTNQIVVSPIEPNWERYCGAKCGTEKCDLGGGDVLIEYSFGCIAQHEETKRYYRRNMASSGAEIRINGRVLASNLFTEIWQIQQHNTYNLFLATINIKSDNKEALPPTKSSKNGLREGDERLEKLFEWIRQKMPTDCLPRSIDNPDDTDERSLFEDLKKAKEIHLPDPKFVTIEKRAFDTFNEKIRIDLYISQGANLVIYEGKKDKLKLLDVYQLMMYWDGLIYDGITPTEAILISSTISKEILDFLPIINNRSDANGNKYNFTFKKWTDEGISYPN